MSVSSLGWGLKDGLGFWRGGRSGAHTTTPPPRNQPTSRKKKKDKKAKEKKSKAKKDAGAGAGCDGGEMRIGGVVVPTYDELFKATGGKRLGAYICIFL